MIVRVKAIVTVGNMELKLVNYEQAKTLKELGFPQNDFKLLHDWYSGKVKDDDPSYPTLELSTKWLREEKGIFIEVTPSYNVNNIFQGFHYEIYIDYTSTNSNWITGDSCFNTLEEALSAGIDKAIETLKKN